MKNYFNKLSIGSVATFFLVIATFLYFSDVSSLFKNTVFYIFQVRDIGRALDVLNGKFIFFGPELTGGGHLPGALYYYLMAAALFIKKSWVSAWILQYIFILASCLFAYYFYFKKYEIKGLAILWPILFAFHPLTSWFIRIFLNVSMMLPFAVCTLICILESFSDSPNLIRRKYFYVACLCIGIGIQFHFSLIFFLLALGFLQLVAKKIRIPHIELKYLLCGLGFFIIPLIPYLVWLLFKEIGIPYGVEPFYTGEAKEVAGTLVYLTGKGVSTPLFLKLKFWSQKIIFTMPFAFFLLIICADLKTFFKENKVLVISFFFSLFPFAMWLFSPQAIRYTILTYVSAIFITIKLFKSILEDKKRVNFFIKISSVTCVALMLSIYYLSYESELKPFLESFLKIGLLFFTASLIWIIINFTMIKNSKNTLLPVIVFFMLTFIMEMVPEKSFIKFNDNDKYMPSASDWHHIWENVNKNTGWSYEEARKRVYFIGHHMSQGPELGFDKKLNFQIGSSMNSKISGFIISNQRKPMGFEFDLRWILRQNIPQDLVDGLNQNKIILNASVSKDVLIMPYYILPSANLPEYFQNLSEGYKQSTIDIELEKVKEFEGVVKAENGFIFKWNECPGHSKFCSTGAIVKVHKDVKHNYNLEIKIIGSALSQITPWISPEWNQAWINPYLQIDCGGSVLRQKIISSIGYNRKLSHNVKIPLFQGNNSILAPLDFKYGFACESKNIRLKLGRESSLVDVITFMEELPAKELSVSL